MTRASGIGIAVFLLCIGASPALAQAPPAAPGRPIELGLGGSLIAPSSVGSTSATLLTPSGGTLKLFDVESRFGVGYGVDATLGFRVARAVWVEASGGWSRATARSRISGDVEAAPATTATEPVSRVSGEGALVWYFADRGSTSWFIRGSGGWMRELVGGNSLVEDGFLGSAGAGLRRWWRENGKGSLKRMGLRVEGRLLLRSSGVAFGEKSLQIAPAASGLIVFGF